ncbi:MAG TPA: hypothetical protein VLR94_02920 [Acidobacteriota bacterium]|nr:hypothetical protein [Acidobacteriota bacterium]
MQRFLIPVLAILLLWGCQSKPEVKYDPDRKEQPAHPQPAAASVPQAGVNALKDIKKIQKQEDQKLKEDKKVLDQVDNQ